MVQVVGNPGQIAGILEKGKQRKEDSHGRQHDGDDPGQHSVYAVRKKAAEPVRSAKGEEQGGKCLLETEKQPRQQPGRIICSGYGKPEDESQQSSMAGYPKSRLVKMRSSRRSRLMPAPGPECTALDAISSARARMLSAMSVLEAVASQSGCFEHGAGFPEDRLDGRLCLWIEAEKVCEPRFQRRAALQKPQGEPAGWKGTARQLLDAGLQKLQSGFHRSRIGDGPCGGGFLGCPPVHPGLWKIDRDSGRFLLRFRLPDAQLPGEKREIDFEARSFASSIKLTHTSAFGQSSRICRARFRLRSRQEALQTATAASAPPKHRKSRVISSSGEWAWREYAPGVSVIR